jgi:hypothetical protein
MPRNEKPGLDTDKGGKDDDIENFSEDETNLHMVILGGFE